MVSIALWVLIFSVGRDGGGIGVTLVLVAVSVGEGCKLWQLVPL